MDYISFNIKVPLLEKAATNVKEIISHIRLNDGIYFDRTRYKKEEILNDLRSNNDQKKIEAVKRLLIAHLMREDVSEFYVEVSKNMSNGNRTLKKLIYNYLSLHANRSDHLSMLTVNSFKKDIASRDFQIRAYALRAMCSSRSLEMIGVVTDSLKIMAKDRSWYVRKTVADVIPSVYNADPDQLVLLRNVLLDLIGDGEVPVVSAAVASFCTMCVEVVPTGKKTDQVAAKPGGVTGEKPDEETPLDRSTPDGSNPANLLHWLSFLHPHYYKLCRYLLIMHPFHQTYLIDLLLKYCRAFYRDPLTNENVNFKELLHLFSCSDGEEEAPPPPVTPAEGNQWRSPSPEDYYGYADGEFADEGLAEELKHCGVDIELFIEKLLLLLSSCSYNVVIQAISSLYHLTKFTFKDNMVHAIISCIMKSSMEGNDHTYVLFIRSVQSIIICLKEDFAAYLSFFYVSSVDSTVKKNIKIDMLYILTNEENRPVVLEELLHALFQPGNDNLIVKKLFRHITAVAVADASCLPTVMHHIICLLNCTLQLYSFEAILSLRQLLRQSDSERISQITFFLIRIFFSIGSTEVQTSVLWTLAKYQNFADHLLIFDLARMLVKRFGQMEAALKVQALHFLLKVWAYRCASWFLRGGEAAGQKRSGKAAVETQTGEAPLEKRIWERPAATTSVYQEQQGKLAEGSNSHVDYVAPHLEDFARYERLCKLALLQGARPEERFDIRETSKFYANVMLRVRELGDKGALNWTLWQRDLYKEPVNEYTLPLCYLKHVFLNTGRGDLPEAFHLSREEMQHVRNSPVGTAQGEEHDDYGEYHFGLDPNRDDGDVQMDLKNPLVLQLNTFSSILNRRLPSYVELPDFADEDLPRSAHMTNRKKAKQPKTSISSRDVQISYKPHLSSDRVFSNLDEFYREEGNLVDGQTGCTQNMRHPTGGLLPNRGTKIQGEDDESDDEQNEAPPKVAHTADTYLAGECTSANSFSKMNEQQINDIEKFFFSDEEDFQGAE